MTQRAIYGEEKEILAELVRIGFKDPVQIGEGGFNRVYRVRDLRDGSFLAVKAGQSRKILAAEAKLMKGLKHPLFAGYRGYLERERFACLLMEYVPGSTLEALLARRGGFSAARAAFVVRELAEGLSYLHRQELIFRDLKPGNVMIRQDGRVKLVDLGCVCRIDRGRKSIAGTPGFAAPEQLLLGEATGIYSDSYALGQVLKCMLSDRRGMQKGRKEDTERERILKLEHLILACTGDRPDARIAGMRQIINTASDVLSERRGTAPADPGRFVLKQDIIKGPGKRST